MTSKIPDHARRSTVSGDVIDTEQCPVCGHAIETRRKTNLSVIDLIGAGTVISLLVFVLYLVLSDISWGKLILGLVSLLLVAFIWFFGGKAEMQRQRGFSNPWDGVHGAIAAPLFLAWVIARYFVRYEVIEQRICPNCGFHERDE